MFLGASLQCFGPQLGMFSILGAPLPPQEPPRGDLRCSLAAAFAHRKANLETGALRVAEGSPKRHPKGAKMEPKGGPRRSARRSATEKANVEESMARPVFAACPEAAKGAEKEPKSTRSRPNCGPESTPGRETEKVSEKEPFGSTFGRLWEPRGTRGGAAGHGGGRIRGRKTPALLPFEGREKEPLKNRTRGMRGGMRGGPGGSFRGVSKI